MSVRSVWMFTMARLSAHHCKHPYRSPAHILSTTYKCNPILQVPVEQTWLLHASHTVYCVC